MEDSVRLTLSLRSLMSLTERLTDSERDLLQRAKTQLIENPPVWVPQTGPQTLAYLSLADELFYGGSAGGGKALALDTLLFTPDGWTSIGALEVGHRVFGLDGTPRYVLACSEVMFDRPCFAVVFDGGEQIVADAGHLWQTECQGRTATLRTSDIAATIAKGHTIDAPNGVSRRVMFRIESVQSVPSVPVRCIQVCGDDGMFLVSESCIPTHNSDLLLGLAATAHHKSLILRREATQLKELTDRLQEISGTAGRWRSIGYGGLMRDLPGGRQIELSGCEFEDDKRKYQGRPHDLKAFDELPNFSEGQFDFIGAWNRTVVPDQRCRRVGAGNPPTNAEGEWVIRRWGPWLDRQHARPAKPAEIRWFARIKGKEVEREDATPFEHDGDTIKPFGRTFIPALLSDNPILASTGYGDTLANLPEPLRSQLLKGDFTAGREDHEWQLIPTAWVIEAQRRWTPEGRAGRALDCMSIDVARGGRDKTTFAKRYGNWFANVVKIPGKETPDGPSVAGKVLMELGEPGDLQAALHIDVISVGGSPYDSLRAVKIAKLNVWPINFAEASGKKDRSGVLIMRNLRAEAHWALREALDPKSGDDLALPPDPEVLADLTAPRWKMTASGVLVEPKEDIIARIGRSPDVGDAIAMSMLPVRRIGGFKLETF